MGNSFVDFLLSKGLYDEIVITKENVHELYSLIAGREKISVYCNECKETRVFMMYNTVFYVPSMDGSIQSRSLVDDLVYFQNLQTNSNNPIIRQLNEIGDWSWTNPQLQMYTRILHFDFLCAMDPNHHLDFIAGTSGNIMKKIGQYPSIADITFPELEQYKKVINDKSRREMRKAIGLFTHGIGAGSFVYLRRIFEEILNEAKKKAENDVSLDFTEYETLRVVEKIELIKDYLPKMVVDNKAIYGIVSKGIHELSEEECIKYFSHITRQHICYFAAVGRKEKKGRKRNTTTEIIIENCFRNNQ